MRKILIASHSKLADGMKRTVQFFLGEQTDITAICAYEGEETLESMVKQYFSKVKKADEVLVFTDMIGGSVNQKLLPYINKPHVHIITGFFLGIILELTLSDTEYLNSEMIERILNKSKESIIYMNTYAVRIDDIEI